MVKVISSRHFVPHLVSQTGTSGPRIFLKLKTELAELDLEAQIHSHIDQPEVSVHHPVLDIRGAGRSPQHLKHSATSRSFLLSWRSKKNCPEGGCGTKKALEGQKCGGAGRGASKVSTGRTAPQKGKSDYVGSFGKREARKGLSQFESEGKPGQEPRMRPGMRDL